MKKLLLASTVLTLCSSSILLFQIACTKTVHAQAGVYVLPPATTSTLGGVIVGSGLSIASNGTLSTTSTATGVAQQNKLAVELGYSNDSLMIVNYDGSSPTIVTLPVPNGQSMAYGGQDIILSPDGKTIFFQTVATTGANNTFYIYSCGVDGTARKLVYTSGINAATPLLVNAY